MYSTDADATPYKASEPFTLHTSASFWNLLSHPQTLPKDSPAVTTTTTTMTQDSSIQVPQVTLLFVHGFSKEIWEPIACRLQASKLLESVSAEVVAFDMPFHGANRDESVAPKLLRENIKSPRVEYPVSEWVEWGPTAIYEQVVQLHRYQQENKLPRSKLIGIAHSMDAASMWKTDVLYPGSFDGLVRFEPIYGVDEMKADFLVSVTLQRETKWMLRAEAVAHFEGFRNFATWNREALAAYLKGALVQEESGSTVLTCHPHIEAALYSGKILHLSEDELARPQCQVSFHTTSHSQLCAMPFFVAMIEKHPEIYKLSAPMQNASHPMLLKKPDEAACEILDELTHMEPFSTSDSGHHPVVEV